MTMTALQGTSRRDLLLLAGSAAAASVVADRVSAQGVRQVTIGLSSSSLGAAGYRLSNELGLFACAPSGPLRQIG